MYKKGFIISIVCVFTLNLFALPMSDISKGDTLWIDKIFDKKITVLELNYSENLVKTIDKNSKIEWVKNTKIMNKNQKSLEDKAEYEIGKKGAKMLFNWLTKEKVEE